MMYLGDSGGMISRLLGALVLNARRAVAALLVVTDDPAVKLDSKGVGSDGAMLADRASS